MVHLSPELGTLEKHQAQHQLDDAIQAEQECAQRGDPGQTLDFRSLRTLFARACPTAAVVSWSHTGELAACCRLGRLCFLPVDVGIAGPTGFHFVRDDGHAQTDQPVGRDRKSTRLNSSHG